MTMLLTARYGREECCLHAARARGLDISRKIFKFKK